MDDRYCPRCGSPLATVLDSGRERLGCAACGHVHYRNPVPVAMALARQGDRILLVKRGNEPLNGFWAPPAGYVELDESVEAAAIRETAEETGVRIAVEGLQGVYSAPGIGVVLVVYRARVESGTPAPGPEVLGAGLFAPGATPTQPTLAGGSELDRWLLGLLPPLMRGDAAGGGERQARIRDLDGRLRSLLAQVDASRDEMSDGDVDDSLLGQVGALRREIDELHRLEKAT